MSSNDENSFYDENYRAYQKNKMREEMELQKKKSIPDFTTIMGAAIEIPFTSPQAGGSVGGSTPPLGDLTDVELIALADKEYIRYNSVTELWENINMLEPIETEPQILSADGVGPSLNMTGSSYEEIWCKIKKGTTGYTSATVEIQVCDLDSAVDADWTTIYTFTLGSDESDYFSKRYSANYARAKLSNLVGTDISINVGATV